jgi:hypothetical protein
MSSYRNIPNSTLMNAVAVSGTTTYHSSSLGLDTIRNAALQISWTGAMVGTLVVEGSVDGVSFFDIGASIPTQPAGTPSGDLLNIVDVGFRYLRVSYTNASSTGSLTVIGMGKT